MTRRKRALHAMALYAEKKLQDNSRAFSILTQACQETEQALINVQAYQRTYIEQVTDAAPMPAGMWRHKMAFIDCLQSVIDVQTNTLEELKEKKAYGLIAVQKALMHQKSIEHLLEKHKQLLTYQANRKAQAVLDELSCRQAHLSIEQLIHRMDVK